MSHPSRRSQTGTGVNHMCARLRTHCSNTIDRSFSRFTYNATSRLVRKGGTTLDRLTWWTRLSGHVCVQRGEMIPSGGSESRKGAPRRSRLDELSDQFLFFSGIAGAPFGWGRTPPENTVRLPSPPIISPRPSGLVTRADRYASRAAEAPFPESGRQRQIGGYCLKVRQQA